MLRTSWWRRIRVALMVGLVVGGSVAVVVWRRAGDSLERAWLDTMAERRALLVGRAPQEPVLLVGIDDASLSEVRASHQVGWPWPRRLLAEGVDALVALGARAVVLDLPLTDASHLGVADDAVLAASLRAAPAVVLTAPLSTDPEVSRPALAGKWGVLLGFGDDGPSLLELAAPVLGRGVTVFRVEGPGRVELWAGGMRSREEAERLVLQAGNRGRMAPLVACRELDAGEMRTPLDARDWFEASSPPGPQGSGALGVPRFDEATLPWAPLAASSTRVGLREANLLFSARGGSILDDDELSEDDHDLPGDDRVRSWPLGFRRGDRWYASTPMAAAELVAGGEGRVEEGQLRLGDRAVPVSRRGRFLIDWPVAEVLGEPALAGAHVPFSALLAEQARRARKLPGDPRLARAVAGKVVFIGLLAPSISERAAVPVPGMESSAAMAAAAARTVLLGSAPRRASRREDVERTLALSLGGAVYALWVFRRARGMTFLALFGGGGVALVGLAFAWWSFDRFQVDRVWAATLWPVLGFGLSVVASGWLHLGDETTDRSRVIEALGRLAGRDLVDRVLRDPTMLAPERRPLTHLVADLDGVGALVDVLPAPRFAELLGSCFAALSGPVRQAHGHVDKFVGDALYAFWNAPLRRNDHATQACTAALQARARLADQAELQRERFGHAVDVRMGLESGECVVGELGAAGRGDQQTRANYTAVGEAVRLAAFLERANRRYGTRILVGPAVREAAGDGFEFREIDQVTVVGRTEPIRIHELQAFRGELEPVQVAANSAYALALEAWRDHRLEDCAAQLRVALSAQPDDPVCIWLQTRCDEVDRRGDEAWSPAHPLE